MGKDKHGHDTINAQAPPQAVPLAPRSLPDSSQSTQMLVRKPPVDPKTEKAQDHATKLAQKVQTKWNQAQKKIEEGKQGGEIHKEKEAASLQSKLQKYDAKKSLPPTNVPPKPPGTVPPQDTPNVPASTGAQAPKPPANGDVNHVQPAMILPAGKAPKHPAVPPQPKTQSQGGGDTKGKDPQKQPAGKDGHDTKPSKGAPPPDKHTGTQTSGQSKPSKGATGGGTVERGASFDPKEALEKIGFALGGAIAVPAISTLYYDWPGKLLWKALIGAAAGNFLRVLIFDPHDLEVGIEDLAMHPIETVGAYGIGIVFMDVLALAVGYDTGILEVVGPVIGMEGGQLVLAISAYAAWAMYMANVVPQILYLEQVLVWAVNRILRRCPNDRPPYLDGDGHLKANYDYGAKYIIERDIPEFFEGQLKIWFRTVENVINGKAILGPLYAPAWSYGEAFRHIGRALVDALVSFTPQQNCAKKS